MEAVNHNFAQNNIMEFLTQENKYRNKELSWLAFNARVLQEAENKEVPLLERLMFLGIYSNNLDEFFKVRVATLQRLARLGKKDRKALYHDPREVITKIGETVLNQQRRFESIYNDIKIELDKEGIVIVDESQLNEQQKEFALQYFKNKIQPRLFPVYLTNETDLTTLKDEDIYLAIHLESPSEKQAFAMITIPSDVIERFIVLPNAGDKKYIILQDDVIRIGLPQIFNILNYKVHGAYTFKITRDAELDLNDDLSDSYIRKIAKGLEQRKIGSAVRMVYDSTMPVDIVNYFIERLGLKDLGSLVPGGRYHNFKDLMSFPAMGKKHLKYEKWPQLNHPDIKESESIFNVIRKKDVMLHFPYHQFSSLIDLLREAAIDPKVKVIKMTLYRVASNSSIMKALINAAKNGKQVTAILELQARFDEEANMFWSKKLADAGVKVIFGVPGLKVHSKLLLIEKKEEKSTITLAGIGTGNFNESSANTFCDNLLLTTHKEVATDVKNIFEFFYRNYKVNSFKQLIVAPFYLRSKVTKLIKDEIKNAKEGKYAEIYLKLNNLSDRNIIDLLYQAFKTGVVLKINVRGMFTMIPNPENLDKGIESIGIIDRYLEHSRVLYFHANGERKVFISSADMMERNLDRRTEIICPILDPEIKEEIIKMIDLQWADNVSTRILDNELLNKYRNTDSEVKIRSQYEFYKYLKEKSERK